MRITDLLSAESIELNGTAKNKTDVLNQMVDLMENLQLLLHRDLQQWL